MEYSPFIDKKGNKIGLEKLRFANILSIEENGIDAFLSHKLPHS